MIDPLHGWNCSYKPQFLGFVVTLLLIMAAYRFVTHSELPGTVLLVTVISIGVLQALLQFVFFLHLGLETKPHWGVWTFLFTVLVVLIVVGGSMWIMQNLNYDLMMRH